MGLRSLVYVDSCVLIYALEHHSQFSEAARRCLANQLAEDRTLAISPLVQLECLVQPLGACRTLRCYQEAVTELL